MAESTIISGVSVFVETKQAITTTQALMTNLDGLQKKLEGMSKGVNLNPFKGLTARKAVAISEAIASVTSRTPTSVLPAYFERLSLSLKNLPTNASLGGFNKNLDKLLKIRVVPNSKIITFLEGMNRAMVGFPESSGLSKLVTSLHKLGSININKGTLEGYISFLTKLVSPLIALRPTEGIMMSLSRGFSSLQRIFSLTNIDKKGMSIIAFLNNLRKPLMALRSQVGTLFALSGAFRAFANSFAKTKGKGVITNLSRLGNGFTKMTTKANTATRSLSRFRMGLSSTNRVASLVSRTIMSLFAGFSVLMIGRSALRSFVEFDRVLRKIKVVAQFDDVVTGLDMVAKKVEQTAMKLGVLPAELAKAWEDIEQAQFHGSKALALFDASASLSVGGDTKVNKAAKLLAKIMNAYGKDPRTEAKKVSDMLFATQELGMAKIAEMAEHVPKILSSFRGSKINLSDLLGGVATLTNASSDMSKSGTALRTMVLKITKGTKGLNKLFGEQSGKTLYEKGLGYVLKRMREDTQGMNYKIAALGFGRKDIEGVATILRSDIYQKFLDNSKKIGEKSAGATARAVEVMMYSVEKQMDRLKATFRVLGNTILFTFKAELISALKFIIKIVQKMIVFVEQNKKMIKSMVMVTSAFFAVGASALIIDITLKSMVYLMSEMVSFSLVFVKIMKTAIIPFKIITGLMKGMMIIPKLMVGAFTWVFTSLSFLGTIVGIVSSFIPVLAAGVTAIGGAILLLSTYALLPGNKFSEKWDNISKSIKKTLEFMSEKAKNIMGFMFGFFMHFKENMDIIGEYLTPENVGKNFKALVTFIENTIGNPIIWSNIVETIYTIFSGFFSWYTQNWHSTVVEMGRDLVSILTLALKKVTSSIISSLANMETKIILNRESMDELKAAKKEYEKGAGKKRIFDPYSMSSRDETERSYQERRAKELAVFEAKKQRIKERYAIKIATYEEMLVTEKVDKLVAAEKLLFKKREKSALESVWSAKTKEDFEKSTNRLLALTKTHQKAISDIKDIYSGDAYIGKKTTLADHLDVGKLGKLSKSTFAQVISAYKEMVGAMVPIKLNIAGGVDKAMETMAAFQKAYDRWMKGKEAPTPAETPSKVDSANYKAVQAMQRGSREAFDTYLRGSSNNYQKELLETTKEQTRNTKKIATNTDIMAKLTKLPVGNTQIVVVGG